MKQKKLLWSLIAVLAGVVLAVCLYGIWQEEKPRLIPEELPAVTEQEPEETPALELPANFQSAMDKYPDVYAWLQMPGTTIDYPVVQRFGDDSYYIQRNLDGEKDLAGTLFTEYQYNSKSFEDPVTIIYGHHMRDGSMFGNLQTHMTDHPVEESDILYVYLPDCRKTYQVFAAVPYDGSHIMYYHDFHDANQFDTFIEDIMTTRSLSANVNETWRPKADDHVLILSTCLAGNNTNRFLVLAVETQEEPVRNAS